MIEPNLSDEVLDEWMRSQEPWPVDAAISLLLRIDPDTFPFKIRHRKPNLPHIVLRAWTGVRMAIARGFLVDLSIEITKKKTAADYSVYKKDFIAWAEDGWDDDSSHLTAALKRYDDLEERPWKTGPETRTEITHRVFNELMHQLLPAERNSISNRKLLAKMLNHAGEDSGVYRLTEANPLLTKWKSSYKPT